MILLFMKRLTPIRLVFCYIALYSYDSIYVGRFHVERRPQVAFVVGSHIQLFVKQMVIFWDKIWRKYSIPKRFCEATDNLFVLKCEILLFIQVFNNLACFSKVSLREGDEIG